MITAFSSSIRSRTTNTNATIRSDRRRNRGKCYKDSCLIIGSCFVILRRFYKRLGFRHISPFLFLIAYTILGAAIMQYVESPYENIKERDRLSRIDELRNTTSWKLAHVLSDGIMSDETKHMQTRDLIRWYEKQLGIQQQAQLHWDMYGALFYVGTVYTTIGYGNISPSTTAGRLLTVLYAIFGIPLVLAILNDLGQLMRQVINRTWYRLINYRFCHAHIPLTKKPVIPEDDEAEDDDLDVDPVPITVALSLTLGWVLFCSALFCLWETNWTYGNALWFFFISLSTIGFGDVLPEKPQYMIANFGFVIIGLCLVSMTLGVIQQRIEEFLYRMMKLIKEEYQAAIDQGDIPLKADRLLSNAWQKQPWHIRFLAPRLLSYKCHQRLDHCAISISKGVSFHSTLRNLMLYKNIHIDLKDRSINRSDHKNRSIDQDRSKYRSNDIETGLANPRPPEYSDCFPVFSNCASIQKLFCDTSTQTERGRALYDLIMNNENHRSRKSSLPDQKSHRLSMRDQSVQACIRVQTMHVAVGENGGKKKRSKSALTRSKRKAENVDTIITDCETSIERVEQGVQTDDSYLRLASKLEALRTNRADSLAIMVTPKARRPSLPQTIVQKTNSVKI